MVSEKIKEIICKDAPAAIGPYSQAVRAGNLVFISGQIPIDPTTGEVIRGGIREQTAKVLRNIERILVSQGAGLENVVKCGVFLKDIGDYAAMNEVYSLTFTGNVKPARYVVQVSGLPKNAMIEISCDAVIG